MDIFSTQQQNKKIAEEEKREHNRLISDIRKVITSPEGRRFIWWILQKAHIFHISFNLNTKLEDFREGERNIGNELLNRVNEADSGAFARMQNEYLSEQASKKAVKEAEKQEDK